jgi:hypothetical protein
MNTYHKYIVVALAAIGLASCSDFLDKEPLSEGTEAIAYKNAEQFREAANEFYNYLPGWSYNSMDRGSDIGGLGTNGGGSAPEDDGTWNSEYSHIRQYNILLEKAAEYNGDDIEASVGAAYFFRAFSYFNLLKTFGGVPILDHVADVNDPALQAKRNSRYEVANFIFNDLRMAIERLPKESSISTSDKGHISKEAAQAFLGRVLLYEGTWEKYVPSIGYDLDGDGESVGAGTAKPDGYPSVQAMLQESKENSKAVMDEAATNHTYELWNECDSLSYYYLFSIDDKGGNISNFMGAGKSTNKEFIISKKYDYDLRRVGINLSHAVITWQAVGISTQFGESFLCRNGLPIRLSYTGNMADAVDNPQFEGYDTFEGPYRNRDYRFVGCTYVPDRTTWSCRPEDNRQCTQLGQPYPTPVFPKNNDVYDASDPAYTSPCGIFRPVLRNNSTAYGYGSRKYLAEGAGRSPQNEAADWPILRLAEVYLNYAEATCELQNGQISDEDLDISINLLRDRARVAHLSNALIEGVWDAGWWDWKTNKTVCHKMNMLDEIRRERACELFGEGFRFDDLKRWGIAQDNLTGQVLGSHVLNTAYTKYTANDRTYFGEPCYYPEKYPLFYGIYEGTGPDDPDYGRSIAVLSSSLQFTQRDYLSPLPLRQIRLNPNLKQNPGW